ncbi:MAG: GNAT family N-acetyltransferase [Nocardioides sp.]
MQITSLGFRTDLALLEQGGSTVDDRGDHLVVRSPHNPTFWWGNFLLLDAPPPPEQTDRWLQVFAREFPDAEHIAIGIDGTSLTAADASGFVDRGLSAETSSVMTASSVHEPPRPNRDATYRQLSSDDDWAQLVELRMAAMDDSHDVEGYRRFSEAKVATIRAMTEQGHGGWFGAFEDGVLQSGMGLFRASEGLARFQNVETRPDARGRGLAGTLVHHVSRYGFDELGAHTLVMVADPDYLAIRIYRSVGFAETESMLQVERPPAQDR